MIHNRESDHGAWRSALLERDAELETLVEDGMERLLVDVGLLLGTMRKDPMRQQLDNDEGIAKTVGIERDYIASV